jgi:hypothetical protein
MGRGMPMMMSTALLVGPAGLTLAVVESAQVIQTRYGTAVGSLIACPEPRSW